jgi:hypothetical protein
MSKLSPKAEKALSELEALAKSKAVERAAQPNPKLPPADRIAAPHEELCHDPAAGACDQAH